MTEPISGRGEEDDIMDNSTFHALLVGVDGYAPNRLSNGGTYLPLGGCVSDALRIEAMLTARVKGHRLAITKLLAPANGTGDGASAPTADNIRRALAELADRARPGDQVYVHYSGHGGRVRTAWPDLKGTNGFDEALVPIDIGRPDQPGGSINTRPERYLRDVELASYLDRLAGKVDPVTGEGVTTTLVLDCCHSGGATRGTGELARRSSSGGAPSPGDPAGTLDRCGIGAHSGFDDRERAAMAASLLRLRSSASASASAPVRATSPAGTSWLPPAKSYVLLAACRDVEAALEYAADGRPRAGVLTDAFLEALATLGTDQTWKTIYDRVLARVHGRFPSQTPQLLGELDRHVFGVDLAPIPHAFAVTAVHPERCTLTINAGLALNVTNGTELGIYRPGTTDFSLLEERLAVATVVEASGLEAVALLDPASDPSRIAVGAPAVVQALPLRRRVELLRRADLPPAIASKQDAALAAVAHAIANDGRGFVQTCAPRTTPHYQVVVSPSGTYEVCDPQGQPFPDLEPLVPLDATGGAHSIVAQLRRLGRYHTVLEMSEPSPELWNHLRVELLAAPPGWTDGRPTAEVGGTPLERAGDAYTVETGTWLWLRVINTRPAVPVNVALIDLSRTWEIELIVPHPGDLAGKRYETVGEQARTFALRMVAPVPETLDVLKLFVATGDVDFPSLATGAKRATTQGIHSALGRLIDAITATEHRMREVMRPRSTSSPWGVREFRIRTVQP